MRIYRIDERRGGAMEKAQSKEAKKPEDGLELEVLDSRSKSISPTMEKWLKLRTRSVLEAGWLTFDELPNGQDVDRYDTSDYETHHVLIHNDSGELAAGVRLTRVEDIDDSLSREMIADNEMVQDFDKAVKMMGLDKAAEEGNLWDVTRLLNNRDASLPEQIKGMLQIFGAGVPITNDGGESNPQWIFTTTPEIVDFLEKSGVEPVAELCRGEQADRNGAIEEIVVCTLPANEAFHSVLAENARSKKNRNAHEIVTGFEKMVDSSVVSPAA